MQLKDHVYLMAEYNQWMNIKLYDACTQITDEQLKEDRQAFFGSVIGTLNHIAVADTIWLKRFVPVLTSVSQQDLILALPAPTALDTILFHQLKDLTSYRQHVDTAFLSLAETLTDDELCQVITYKNTKGDEFRRVFFSVLMHVFNHQTHHRGQATTLLSQFGIDIGVTDLIARVPTC